MIEIIKITTGFAVKFPFALKDAFKETFKTAKWNPDYKRWELGPRSLKRLEAWAAEAKLADKTAVARDEADLTDEELKRAKLDLQQVIAETGKLEDLIARMVAAEALLKQAKRQLAKARETKSATEASARAKRNEVEDLLSSVFDISAVKKAIEVMASNMVPADRSKKERFEEARQIVKTARDQMRKAGFRCDYLETAACANVNRPDRDNPARISQIKWYQLTEYTEDE